MESSLNRRLAIVPTAFVIPIKGGKRGEITLMVSIEVKMTLKQPNLVSEMESKEVLENL